MSRFTNAFMSRTKVSQKPGTALLANTVALTIDSEARLSTGGPMSL